MAVFAFGKELYGRLGLGGTAATAAWVDVPTKVKPLRSSVVQVSAGDSHTACVTKEGKVFAWGSAHYGMLGVGDTSAMPVNRGGYPYQPVPTEVAGLEGVVQVSAGDPSIAAQRSSKALRRRC